MKPSTLAMILAGVTVLTITGCGQNIAEKAVQSAINNSTGGQSNVDLSGGNINIKDNKTGASYQAGADVPLPTNFPADVYKIDGKVISAVSQAGDNSYWVMIQTAKSAADAGAAYQSELPKTGWKITANANYGGVVTLSAEKDNRSLAIMIAPGGEDGSQTSVTLSESTNK